MRFFAVLLALIVTSLPAVAQHGEERRYFKDWLAACRADGYCSATTYQNPNPGNGTVADYVLRVGRHAEGIYWEMSFTTVATMGDAAQPFDVAVDGGWEGFEGPAEIAAYGSVNDFFLLGPKAQAVMDRLAPGSELTVGFTDTDGNRQQAVFSLAGLTASLIWIDEMQGRLGSERVAEAPPVGLDPAAGSGPAEVPPMLMAQHAADTGCQPMAELANGNDVEIVALDADTAMYLLPCWSGAYNFGWKAYVERFEGEYALQSFAEFNPWAGWTATTDLVNYAWDDAAKTISTFNKGRGIGDCGTAGTWEWHEFAFRLLSFAAKEECDEGDPGDFPVVYSREER